MTPDPASSPVSVRRRWKWVVILPAVAAGLLLACRFILLPWLVGSKYFHDKLQKGIEQAIGSPVRLGRLQAGGWSGLVLNLEELRMANPPGFSPAEWLVAESLTVPVGAYALISRRIEISDFTVARARVRIEQDAEGEFNLQRLGRADQVARASGFSASGFLQANTASPASPAFLLGKLKGSITEAQVSLIPAAGPPLTIDHLTATAGLDGPDEPLRFGVSPSTPEGAQPMPSLKIGGELRMVRGGQFLSSPSAGKVVVEVKSIPLDLLQHFLGPYGFSGIGRLASLGGRLESRQALDFDAGNYQWSGTVKLKDAGVKVAFLLNLPLGAVSFEHEIAYREAVSEWEFRKVSWESSALDWRLKGLVAGQGEAVGLQLELSSTLRLDFIERNLGRLLRLIGPSVAVGGEARLHIHAEGPLSRPKVQLIFHLQDSGLGWSDWLQKKAGDAFEVKWTGEVALYAGESEAVRDVEESTGIGQFLIHSLPGQFEIRAEQVILGGMPLKTIQVDGDFKGGAVDFKASGAIGSKGKLGLSVHSGGSEGLWDIRCGIAMELSETESVLFPWGPRSCQLSAPISMDAVLRLRGDPFNLRELWQGCAGQGSFKIGPGAVKRIGTQPALKLLIQGPVLSAIAGGMVADELRFETFSLQFSLKNSVLYVNAMNFVCPSLATIQGTGAFSFESGEIRWDLTMVPREDVADGVARALELLTDRKIPLRIEGTWARPKIEYKVPQEVMEQLGGKPSSEGEAPSEIPEE